MIDLVDSRTLAATIGGRRRFVARLRLLEAEHRAGRIGEGELQQRATALVAYTDTCGATGSRRRVLGGA